MPQFWVPGSAGAPSRSSPAQGALWTPRAPCPPPGPQLLRKRNSSDGQDKLFQSGTTSVEVTTVTMAFKALSCPLARSLTIHLGRLLGRTASLDCGPLGQSRSLRAQHNCIRATSKHLHGSKHPALLSKRNRSQQLHIDGTLDGLGATSEGRARGQLLAASGGTRLQSHKSSPHSIEEEFFQLSVLARRFTAKQERPFRWCWATSQEELCATWLHTT